MPEEAHPTPREVFERLLDGITGGAGEGLADLYGEDVVIEMPMAAPAPARIEGREQLRAHFANAPRIPLEFEAGNVVVHQTADPEVIIAEFDYHGRATTTGRAFHVANIQVLRIREGRIVATRDYHNHLALADALGTLPGIVSALDEQRRHVSPQEQVVTDA
jgi:ketosteroid isomerase-like protein